MTRRLNNIKGAVKYPHCGKGKVIVSADASGQSCQGCPKRKGWFIVDTDTMTAWPADPVKEGYDMVVNN